MHQTFKSLRHSVSVGPLISAFSISRQVPVSSALSFPLIPSQSVNLLLLQWWRQPFRSSSSTSP
uniref:Uncharacterized protein n=1 Tax=Cannabis sativa TaxID=3483 RepID=A0A803R8P5_CANSA